MMQKTLRRALVAAMAVAVSACGDSPLGPEADLTQEEVEEMMDAMSAVGAFTFFPTGFSIQSVDGQVAAVVAPFNESADCPSGGTVSTSGSMNVNETTGNFSAQYTSSYSNCKAQSNTGRVWTFNGDPNISNTMTFTSNATTGAYTVTGTQSGGLRFSSNGTSGRCSISLSWNMSTSANGVATGSLTGTVCGESVSQSITD
jgi:hypothetical protein